MAARRLTLLVAAALALAGCNIRFDFDDVRGADLAYVDGDGVWRIIGDPDPIWTEPDDGWMVPVAADYDGDGRTDAAAYSMDSGTWYTNGGRGSFSFPAPARTQGCQCWVVPVPADYDGDGDDDPAFFDEATATWHVEGQAPVAFGRPFDDPLTPAVSGIPLHDIAAPADYDGDGTDDIAVYRPYTGEVLIEGATEPIDSGVFYGFPTPGNHNNGSGDELAVMQVEGHRWFVEGEGTRWPFQPTTNHLPVPADYDGDGHLDLAIWGMSPSGIVQVEDQIPMGVPSSSPVAAPPAATFNALVLTFAGEECASSLITEFPCPGTPGLAVDIATGAWFLAGADLDWQEQPLAWQGPALAAPARGDYDGDGEPEPAAASRLTGQWTTDGGRGTFSFPAPADIDSDPTTSVYPVPGDYDGDGDTDAAWYRDADATWHIEGVGVVQHGRSTTTTPTFDGHPVHDIPVPGDYDGDGDTDLAAYRIDTGELHVLGSAPLATGWPAGDPVVGDWDGDGTDELGLWDDAAGATDWYLPGQAVDPAPHPSAVAGWVTVADWDGDGDDDFGVLAKVADAWGMRRWATGPQQFSADLFGGSTVYPAVGATSTVTNDAFVTAYVDHCVLGTPDPGECV